MFSRIKEKAKQNPFVVACYRELFKKSVFSRQTIAEIRPFRVRHVASPVDRINLLVPSINEAHYFGGINTAIAFFESIAEKTGNRVNYRMIVTDADPDSAALKRFETYTPLSTNPSKTDLSIKKALFRLSDRENAVLDVSVKDRFLATAWWTAYAVLENIFRHSEKIEGERHPLAYFIQDFEPGFYNWSSHYALAEATYASGAPTIAIYNSSFLGDYFGGRGYPFKKTYVFEPKLNPKLKRHLPKDRRERKKQIVFYGRPSTERNCFPIIVEALRLWVQKQHDPGKWRLISVGEAHPPVDIGNGLTLASLGKLSLPDYAKLLAESAIGVSLMVSPHPSYPPLEMAHFGLLTITNTFENKDLSKSHGNIMSLSALTPHRLAEAIAEMIKAYSTDPLRASAGKSMIPAYWDDSPQFAFIDELLDDWGIRI